MIDTISFDAPNSEWNAFLSSQPKSHPHHFSTPFSESGQIYFKCLLEIINKRATRIGNVGNLKKLIEAISNERAKKLIYTWFDSYSPIRHRKTKRGEIIYEVIKDYMTLYNPVDGKCHPFYTINERPIKFAKKDGKFTESAKENKPEKVKIVEFDVTRPPKSDLDYTIKRAKIAFNTFTSDRSIENKNKLIDLINCIPTESTATGGRPFLQGGSPGLGRR